MCSPNRSRYDSIVIDTPPVNSVADAALLIRHCDGVLLVARAGTTAREAHRAVGERVLLAEERGRALDSTDTTALGVPGAPVDALGSVLGKRTAGSTHPDAVAASIAATRAAVSTLSESLT